MRKILKFLFIKIIFVFFIFFLVFAKDVITFSINPLYGIFIELVGNNQKFEYNILADHLDHHHFDISPVKMKKLQQSKIAFFIGTLELEGKILLAKKDNPQNILVFSNYVSYDNDPHLWVSVKNFIKMIDTTFNYLYSNKKLKNLNKKELYNNYKKLYSKYVNLDKKLTEFFKNNRDILILAHHNEFFYFSRDYNIKIEPIFNYESELSARDLEKISKKLKTYKKVYLILPSDNEKKLIQYVKSINPNVKFIIFNSNSVDLYNQFKNFILE